MMESPTGRNGVLCPSEYERGERRVLSALCAAWLLKENPDFRLKRAAVVLDVPYRKRLLDFYVLVGACRSPDPESETLRFILGKSAYAAAARAIDEAPIYSEWLTSPSSEWK